MKERWEPASASSSSSATPPASMLDLTLLATLQLRLTFLSRSGQSSTKPTRPSWPSSRHSSMRRWCSSIGELEPAARCRVEEDAEHVLRRVRLAAGRACPVFFVHVRSSMREAAPVWHATAGKKRAFNLLQRLHFSLDFVLKFSAEVLAYCSGDMYQSVPTSCVRGGGSAADLLRPKS
ncbi:hypothetical protein OsI_31150 [Oryza sativa Indica Group]|uniref:Uncharacterized protein n=1 Tax=Oryza sativa subsp. indica TaxID=39946 RepID=B8BEZ8_ORYSI|nr:hypothetical protein OsI_31150 [Oryza sativa Indica Group]